jgi:hypothetical protein
MSATARWHNSRRFTIGCSQYTLLNRGGVDTRQTHPLTHYAHPLTHHRLAYSLSHSLDPLCSIADRGGVDTRQTHALTHSSTHSSSVLLPHSPSFCLLALPRTHHRLAYSLSHSLAIRLAYSLSHSLDPGGADITYSLSHSLSHSLKPRWR